MSIYKKILEKLKAKHELSDLEESFVPTGCSELKCPVIVEAKKKELTTFEKELAEVLARVQ